MALLHHAQLVPSKLELLAGWLPSQPFWPGDADASALERVASFRFDDPAGKVGVETIFVRAGDTVIQVPLTYREEPLKGGEPAFIGTTEHSVLGTRWVYDATGDPVYIAELVLAAVKGGREVEQYYEEHGRRVVRPGDAQVRGSGHPDAVVQATPTDAAALVRESDATSTWVHADGVDVRVVRGMDPASAPSDAEASGWTLTGDWGGATGVLLATVRRL